ncbi:MAG: hypothetical protein KY467_05320 [Gemmatimonadetes bacterium]|nr:hypothetical protein [Gemmatimonadota bacterium]
MSAPAWAAAGGVAGAALMMGSLYAGRAAGVMDADFARYQGCLLLRRADASAEAAGWAFHLGMGAVLGLGYTVVYTVSGVEPGWDTGALLGAAHGLLAGAALPMMDAANPCVRAGTLPRYGAFARRRGVVMIAGFVAGHVLFGALVGAAYGAHRT